MIVLDKAHYECYIYIMNMYSLSEDNMQTTVGGAKMAQLSRKERDRKLRQQDILQAAEHVFATKGYHEATMQDIAREAQYAAGTIYLYFKDKEALYLALLEKKIQHFIASIKGKVKQAEGINEKIRVLVYEQLSYFGENQDFFRIYFSGREGVQWTIKDKLSTGSVNKFMQHLEYVAGLLGEAQKENIIRKDVPAERLAFVLSSIMNSVILRWLKHEPYSKEDLAETSENILDVFLHGAGRKK